MNQQLADFGISGGAPAPSNPMFRGTAMPMRTTASSRIQKHEVIPQNNIVLGTGPSGLANNVEVYNPMMTQTRPDNYDENINPCIQSMNSDVFSQFSMPSNNLLINQNMKAGAFSASNFSESQTVPRMRNFENIPDMPVPLELFNNAREIANNAAQGTGSSASEFNSAIRSYNEKPISNIEKNPVPLMACQSNYDQNQTSYQQSELTSESFQSAEQIAMYHELKAKKKMQDKEAKLMSFQSKTKANAMRKMREDQTSNKLNEADLKKQKIKENQLKAKEYAKQTKKKSIQVTTGQVKQQTVNKPQKDLENAESGYGAGTYVNQDISKDISMTQMGIVNIENSLSKISPGPRHDSNKRAQESNSRFFNNTKHDQIIEEVSEENHSMSAQSQPKRQNIQQVNGYQMPGRPPVLPKPQVTSAFSQKQEGQKATNPLLKIYQRIDQFELERQGLGHKSEFEGDNGGLNAALQYSMLQRFRQDKNFNAVDKYKPQSMDDDEQKAINNRENQWIRDNTLTDEQRQLEKKSQVEKARYVTALKALVKEKGSKMNSDSSSIPALCSCGAQMENIKQIKRSSSTGRLGGGKEDEPVHMCASNCQFYKNEKGYVRALRDVLHSISLFKN